MKSCLLRLLVAAVVLLTVAQCEQDGTTACRENGKPCDRDSDCCSKLCMFYAHKCVYSGPLGPSTNNKVADKNKAQNEVVDKVGVSQNHVEPVATKTEDKATPSDCVPDLGPCDVSEQCCSKRCHFYLHKCVT